MASLVGSSCVALGPSAVFLAIPDKWVVGSLFSQLWSFTGGSDVDLFTWQDLVNWTLRKIDHHGS